MEIRFAPFLPHQDLWRLDNSCKVLYKGTNFILNKEIGKQIQTYFKDPPPKKKVYCLIIFELGSVVCSLIPSELGLAAKS